MLYSYKNKNRMEIGIVVGHVPALDIIERYLIINHTEPDLVVIDINSTRIKREEIFPISKESDYIKVVARNIVEGASNRLNCQKAIFYKRMQANYPYCSKPKTNIFYYRKCP